MEPESKGTSDPSTGSQTRRFIWPALAGLVLILMLIVYLVSGSLRASESKESATVDRETTDGSAAVFDNVWAPATVIYAAACDEDCIEIKNQRAGGGHTGGFRALVDPKIDDSIAQWGDCIASVMTCYEAQAERADFSSAQDQYLHNCILESSCPDPCLDHYAAEVGEDMTQVDRAFDAVLIGEQAVCLPKEARLP